MGRNSYIEAKTFKEFCVNQSSLIDILNHRMTSIEKNMIEIKSDVGWTKKILFAILGVVVISFFTIIIKSAVGI